MSKGQMENKKIKIDIQHHKKNGVVDLDKSGPRVNDIRNKSSRWRSLPIKNVVKIKEEKRKKSVAYHFYKGLIFVVGGVAGLATIGFLLYWQFFAPRYTAAALLPAETLLYGQVDLKSMLFQDEEKNKQLATIVQESSFSLDKATKIIDREIEPLGIKFATDIKPFLGEKFIFSFFSLPTDTGDQKAEWVFIADVFDKKTAESSLEKISYQAALERENYQGVEIININKKEGESLTKIVFLEDYLVISYSQEHLQTVIDTYQQRNTSLAQQTNFKNINSLTLKEKFVHLYLKPKQLTTFLPSQGNIHVLWESLVGKIETAHITLTAKNQGLAINVEANYPGQKSGQRVSQELIDILPVETSAFIAGRDFNQEFSELRQDLAANSPAVEFYLNNLLRKTEEQAKIEINEELFKLLGEEYLIAFDNGNNKLNYNFIFQLKNQTAVQEKMPTIEEAISNYLGTIYPKKQEIALTDGSKANELWPNQEAFPFIDLSFANATIRTINNPELTDSFSYTIKENKLFISTSLESLKNVLTATDVSNKLANRQYFNKPNTEANNWRSENIIYADLRDFTDYLKISKKNQLYLEPFDTFVFSSFAQDNKLFLRGFLYKE